jgi:hypothetical protein
MLKRKMRLLGFNILKKLSFLAFNMLKKKVRL